MKLLLVTPHLPAAKTYQAGERLVFELIKHLSDRHEVHLVVRVYEGQEKGIELLRSYCKAVYTSFYKRPERRGVFTVPKVVLSYYRLCRKANKISGNEPFDVIHAEWTETGLFLRKRGRMVIEAHDVLAKPMERRYRNSRGMERLLNFFIFQLTRRVEKHIYKKFDAVFVLSGYDKEYLSEIEPSIKASVLSYPPVLALSERRFEREKNSILFLGAMDRGPNVEAVLYFWKEILPLIRKRVPDAKFYVVGSRPVPEVAELAEADKNTVVTGFVEDTEPYYRKVTVFVAPLLTGGGIIVKILDALAAGTPVVTTSVGNEGIGAVSGSQVLIGDSPVDFADKVIRLFEDEKLRDSLSKAGSDFMRANYGYENWSRQLKTGYESIGIAV